MYYGQSKARDQAGVPPALAPRFCQHTALANHSHCLRRKMKKGCSNIEGDNWVLDKKQLSVLGCPALGSVSSAHPTSLRLPHHKDNPSSSSEPGPGSCSALLPSPSVGKGGTPGTVARLRDKNECSWKLSELSENRKPFSLSDTGD